jgi:serine/threonine protein kinase
MFNPTLSTRLSLEGQEYHFSPHPAIPTLVWGQEGRHAIVYRLQNNGDAYALKVFRPAFRHTGLIATAETLWTYHELPGMRVCQQTVITHVGYPELVAQYEDLDYAMVMPWIEGETWFDVLQNRQRTSLDQSRALAENMAWVLYALELNQMAHCDLSSGNIILDPQMIQVNLVDVEDLYSPWLVPPPMVPAGSMGYQHRESAQNGQWGPLGDRFSGIVLMAEMLGWAHPDVRRQAWGESYFAPDELQKDNERYRTLVRVLRLYDPGFAEAFEQAWRSEKIEACPPLKTWYDLLDALPRDPVAEWAPINPKEFQEEPEKKPQTSASSEPSVVVQGASKRRPNLTTGCRVAFVIAMVLWLLCSCAALLTVEWSALGK